MRTFQLFGHHIAYSLSPALHAAALAELGLPHRYVLADVSPADFPAALAALRGHDGGANVTVPHKAAAAQLVDELSPQAAALGAVNTVVVDGGRLIGHNTDLPAVAAEINLLRPHPRHAVVLGAGGAAQAVLYALRERAARVTVLQRRDGSLAQAGTVLPDADLLVNTTPVGTQSAELPVPAEALHPGLAVLDLVYRPTPTALVAAARALGAPAAAGGGMLVGQAWRSLALWLAADGVAVDQSVAPAMWRAFEEGISHD